MSNAWKSRGREWQTLAHLEVEVTADLERWRILDNGNVVAQGVAVWDSTRLYATKSDASPRGKDTPMYEAIAETAIKAEDNRRWQY